ncbi:ATP-binding protein [Streptomyces sp. NPDC006668]|uniref:ATP-binding protein n=1 Tax=Streptomyces sp. NPDC006668 TaxID=3156903 RepID=UPI0033D06FBE
MIVRSLQPEAFGLRIAAYLRPQAAQHPVPRQPPGQAKSLFERFHSRSGSSGLGLSIAAWVAPAHGGSLTVVPRARGGSRFLLTLPVLDEKRPYHSARAPVGDTPHQILRYLRATARGPPNSRQRAKDVHHRFHGTGSQARAARNRFHGRTRDHKVSERFY